MQKSIQQYGGGGEGRPPNKQGRPLCADAPVCPQKNYNQTSKFQNDMHNVREGLTGEGQPGTLPYF